MQVSRGHGFKVYMIIWKQKTWVGWGWTLVTHFFNCSWVNRLEDRKKSLKTLNIIRSYFLPNNEVVWWLLVVNFLMSLVNNKLMRLSTFSEIIRTLVNLEYMKQWGPWPPTLMLWFFVYSAYSRLINAILFSTFEDGVCFTLSIFAGIINLTVVMSMDKDNCWLIFQKMPFALHSVARLFVTNLWF